MFEELLRYNKHSSNNIRQNKYKPNHHHHQRHIQHRSSVFIIVHKTQKDVGSKSHNQKNWDARHHKADQKKHGHIADSIADVRDSVLILCYLNRSLRPLSDR